MGNRVLGLLMVLSLQYVAFSTSAADYMLFTAAEKVRVGELVKTNLSAKFEFEKLKAQADASLKLTPAPIKKLALENDPARTASRAVLRDMSNLYALGYAYLVTGDAKFSDKAREFILAWAKTNEPSGNPYSETHLEPLIVAYDITRETFKEDERKAADLYLRKLVNAEWAATPYTSHWQSHRIKIAGLAAFVLNDVGLVERAVVGFKNQLAANFNENGSSLDYIEHDSLRYQINSIEPLLVFAIAAHKHGIELYDLLPQGGATLRRAVQFLLPYCNGDKEHEEFVHSKKLSDVQPVAYGEAAFSGGTKFQPRTGFKALTLAAYFDDSVSPVIAKIVDKPTGTLASWIMVLNAARPEPLLVVAPKAPPPAAPVKK